MPEMCFPLSDTSFIVVTAYHNANVTQLKADNRSAKDAKKRNAHMPSTVTASGNGDHVASGSNTIAAPPPQPLLTQCKTHIHTTRVKFYSSSFPHSFNDIALLSLNNPSTRNYFGVGVNSGSIGVSVNPSSFGACVTPGYILPVYPSRLSNTSIGATNTAVVPRIGIPGQHIPGLQPFPMLCNHFMFPSAVEGRQQPRR